MGPTQFEDVQNPHVNADDVNSFLQLENIEQKMTMQQMESAGTLQKTPKQVVLTPEEMDKNR